MKITARAWSRATGIQHTLKDEELAARNISVSNDGSLSIDTKIHVGRGMTGDYRLTVSMTGAEALHLAHRAVAGPLEARIAKLETDLARATQAAT